MSSPPPQMNAKERRKLLRHQQQQHGEASTVAAATVLAAVSQDKPVKEEAAEPNAKERRKLAREQQRKAADGSKPMKKEATGAAVNPVKKEAVTGAAVATSATEAAPAGERLNAKQRRLLQRKAIRGDEPEADSKKEHQSASKKRKRKSKAAEGENDDPEAKRKRIHLTLFVGQLPFKCTEAMVRKHFTEAGDIQLRMLTDKKTKKFKGTAFIEVKDSKALGAALSRHHTLLNGRRINVELTASGGGNNSEQRRGKIDSLRKKQSEKQIEKTRALVQKCIDAPGSKLKAEDVDERMIDYLSWFDYTTAKNAMEEYNRCVSDRVKNTKAFFMGILKRFRQTDGAE